MYSSAGEEVAQICIIGTRSVTLTNPPISLAPDIAALLRPETDIKVKHGLIGLLKHLAYAAPARAPLSKAGIVERLFASDIFQPSADVAEMVQVNAIGVVKHLCIGDGESCNLPPPKSEEKKLSVLETKHSQELLRTDAADCQPIRAVDGVAPDPHARPAL